MWGPKVVFPGLSAAPTLMGGKGGKPPFSFSGSWESSNEQWTGIVSSGPGLRRVFSPTIARSGSYLLHQSLAGAATVDYLISAEDCAGLLISASVYCRIDAIGRTTSGALQYRIGAGTFINLQSKSGGASAYSMLSGSFLNAGDDDVTIRIVSNYVADESTYAVSIFDDWSISGV